MREPYVPGEIPRGKLLYRDLWYPHGLLASYVEAGLLRLFGKHLDVFYVFGLVMGVISALLLFQTGVLLEERAAGMAAALAFLFQGFNPTIFNYEFPYAYTAPMGLPFGLRCIVFVLRYILL